MSTRRAAWRSTAGRVAPEPHEVHALNKPAGVVSTARDTHGRPTVVQLVRSPRRLYPVGRLDADTTGLILLTNDGDLADRLTHPRYGVKKVYRARVQPARVSPRALQALREGVELEDGPHRAGAGPPARARGARADDPRGPQAPGAADGRGRGPPGGRARAGGVRAARPARPRARQEPPAHEGGGGAPAPAVGAARPSAAAGRRQGGRSRGRGSRRRNAARSHALEPPTSALAVCAGARWRQSRAIANAGSCQNPPPHEAARATRRHHRRGERGRRHPVGHGGAHARGDGAQLARAGPDGELHLHLHERPRRRVPRRGGATASASRPCRSCAPARSTCPARCRA